MKVQYFGDVNDYRKYALLRLIANTGLKIGVNWLLTPDDGRTDGNKRGYLAQREAWRHYELGCVDKGDSQIAETLIQGGFWGGHVDAGFDERRGMGLS